MKLVHRFLSSIRWRYELYLSEHIDLFGSLKFFLEFFFVWFYYRRSTNVIYVFANKRNVGDYISHLGIKEVLQKNAPMILCSPTAQSITQYQLDYLKKYNPNCHLVIGGGGLLQEVFTPFWTSLLDSGLAYSTVGVGINRMPGRPELASELLKNIAKKAYVFGVRDNYTLNQSHPYGQLHICPATQYVIKTSKKAETINQRVNDQPILLHMYHPSDLRMAGVDIIKLRSSLQQIAIERNWEYKEFNNMSSDQNAAILKVARSHVVVSSRLHGCIMSYAIGIPCVGIVCDEKLGEFISDHTHSPFVKATNLLSSNMDICLDEKISLSLDAEQDKITSSQTQKVISVIEQIAKKTKTTEGKESECH